MEHALKLNASLARTGFRRRASRTGSGEKYIKFVTHCPEATYRALSVRLPRALCPASSFIQNISCQPECLMTLARDQRGNAAHYFPPILPIGRLLHPYHRIPDAPLVRALDVNSDCLAESPLIS
jgi:hypothetical protein